MKEIPVRSSPSLTGAVSAALGSYEFAATIRLDALREIRLLAETGVAEHWSVSATATIRDTLAVLLDCLSLDWFMDLVEGRLRELGYSPVLPSQEDVAQAVFTTAFRFATDPVFRNRAAIDAAWLRSSEAYSGLTALERYTGRLYGDTGLGSAKGGSK